jgi:gluconate kinase
MPHFQCFLQRLGTRQGHLFFSLLFNSVLHVLVHTIGQEKDLKGIQIRKQEKLSVFADKMILHMENTKESTKKKLIRTNK